MRDDAAMAEAPPEAEDAAEERPAPPDDADAEMAEDASDAAAAADDGGVAGLLRSMMVAELSFLGFRLIKKRGSINFFLVAGGLGLI